MDKDNKYYELIEDLIKKHKKYPGHEAILDEIVNDVYSHAEVIIKSVDNESVIKSYLEKTIATSIITVPKRLNFNRNVEHRIISNTISENINDKPVQKVSNELVDKMINSAFSEKSNEFVNTNTYTSDIVTETESDDILNELNNDFEVKNEDFVIPEIDVSTENNIEPNDDIKTEEPVPAVEDLNFESDYEENEILSTDNKTESASENITDESEIVENIEQVETVDEPIETSDEIIEEYEDKPLDISDEDESIESFDTNDITEDNYDNIDLDTTGIEEAAPDIDVPLSEDINAQEFSQEEYPSIESSDFESPEENETISDIETNNSEDENNFSSDTQTLDLAEVSVDNMDFDSDAQNLDEEFVNIDADENALVAEADDANSLTINGEEGLDNDFVSSDSLDEDSQFDFNSEEEISDLNLESDEIIDFTESNDSLDIVEELPEYDVLPENVENDNVIIDNISTPKDNIFDYSVFDYEPSQVNENADLNIKYSDILNLNKKYPDLNIINVYELRYKQNNTIAHIAEILNMTKEAVVQALTELISLV